MYCIRSKNVDHFKDSKFYSTEEPVYSLCNLNERAPLGERFHSLNYANTCAATTRETCARKGQECESDIHRVGLFH